MQLHSASLDLVERPSFKETVELAAHLLQAPMAAITLLGKERQWFKASTGLTMTSTTLEESFCRFTVQLDQVMVVEDALTDPRFSANPLVLGSPHIRSYIGAPLNLPDGSRIGAVCALDSVPRQFDAEAESLLRVLSNHAVAQFQLESLIASQADDIEELRVVEANLAFEARHDSLTGILNRRGLVQQLEALLRFPRSPVAPVTLLFIDLDDFKAINDNLSHETGDRVLAVIASRLRNLVTDVDLVARIGGDEFVLAFIGSPERRIDGTQWAQRALDAICAPVPLDGVTVALGASVGVADSTSAPISAGQLIDHADRAMYTVKHSVAAQPKVWSTALNNQLEDERAMRGFVRSCIERSAITMHFQPIIKLDSGSVLRYEALLRWDETPPVPLDPKKFVSTAEAMGLIAPLGHQILQSSCATAAVWQADQPGVGVSINISPLQVLPSLVGDLEDVLATTGLAPRLLTLEITESSLLEHTDAAEEILRQLHDLGVRISMDDFGTGYSSMAMLCRLPIDEVKIDGPICAGEDPQLVTVTNASIHLGLSLGLEVVAEGIETTEILERIVAMGCRSGQGFLLGRPARALTHSEMTTSATHLDG